MVFSRLHAMGVCLWALGVLAGASAITLNASPTVPASNATSTSRPTTATAMPNPAIERIIKAIPKDLLPVEGEENADRQIKHQKLNSWTEQVIRRPARKSPPTVEINALFQRMDSMARGGEKGYAVRMTMEGAFDGRPYKFQMATFVPATKATALKDAKAGDAFTLKWLMRDPDITVSPAAADTAIVIGMRNPEDFVSLAPFKPSLSAASRPSGAR